jgi:hypothetical protein
VFEGGTSCDNSHLTRTWVCMTKHVGFIVQVGDTKSFCSTMTRAIMLGRLLCNVYRRDSFSITLTITGDSVTFSKDTVVEQKPLLAKFKKMVPESA